ncbi:MAG: DMT family transporter [Saprospiraceae bacterium]|nr:DMT family transporter [Saprospiraceae bacterium]
MKNIVAGLLLASIWGAGAVATKLGIKDVQPLLLITVRYVLAAILLLGYILLIQKHRLPKGKEWISLLVCSMMINGIYSIAYVFALKYATAGIGALATAANPLVITILNGLWLNGKITRNVWIGLLLGLLGVGIVLYPLLQNAYATPLGIGLLAFSIVCYSIGTVYYQRVNWELPRLVINGWLIFISALILVPLTAFFYEDSLNHFTPTFWYSALWLVIPVTIVAAQIWLYLLKAEPTKAALWLYLCPIFGFLFSAIFTKEPISVYTLVGTFLVIGGLYLGKK